MAKALAAANAAPLPEEDPADELALLEESVRMLDTTLAMPCFAEPSRERIHVLASSSRHASFKSGLIPLAGLTLLGLLACAPLVWLDYSSDEWIAEASLTTQFWLGRLGLFSGAILAVILVIQRYAPKRRSNV